jgi:hypothetical protein
MKTFLIACIPLVLWETWKWGNELAAQFPSGLP